MGCGLIGKWGSGWVHLECKCHLPTTNFSEPWEQKTSHRHANERRLKERNDTWASCMCSSTSSMSRWHQTLSSVASWPPYTRNHANHGSHLHTVLKLKRCTTHGVAKICRMAQWGKHLNQSPYNLRFFTQPLHTISMKHMRKTKLKESDLPWLSYNHRKHTYL